MDGDDLAFVWWFSEGLGHIGSDENRSRFRTTTKVCFPQGRPF